MVTLPHEAGFASLSTYFDQATSTPPANVSDAVDMLRARGLRLAPAVLAYCLVFARCLMPIARQPHTKMMRLSSLCVFNVSAWSRFEHIWIHEVGGWSITCPIPFIRQENSYDHHAHWCDVLFQRETEKTLSWTQHFTAVVISFSENLALKRKWRGIPSTWCDSANRYNNATTHSALSFSTYTHQLLQFPDRDRL